ncbi:MAG TPA: hypothetical protein VFC24_13785 [Casimicrobiaceae bacterium]|nr:hypothetical protein [Casimicrobiaceae bacterium]
MRKTLLIGAIAVAGLAGCATEPYDTYGYGPGYYDPYSYYGAPYYGPSVGLGYYYFDNDGHRHWRDRDRSDGRHWQGRGDGNVDRGGGFRGGENAMPDVRSSHGEMGNEAGSGRAGGGGGGHGGGGQQ